MHGYFSDVEVIIRPAIPQGGAGEWRLVAEKVTYEISAETNSAVVTLRVVPRRNSVKMEQFEGTCISHGADDIAASSTDNPAADGHSMPQLNATAGRESADVNMPVESDTQSDVAPLSNNSVSNVDGEITHSPLPQTKAAKLNRTIKSSMKKKRNSGAAATSRVMREPVRSVGATRRNGNLARLRSTAARCSVPNCPKIAIGTTRPTDQHGAMGRRCTLHGGGIRCNIPTCTRHAIGRAVEASASGPRGRRCRVHGGGLACAFPGCANQGFGKSHEPCTEKDGTRKKVHVPRGVRCFKHGGGVRCTVAVTGRRCVKHGGGRRCVVPGCVSFAQGNKVDEDDLGIAGQRCTKHGGGAKCNVHKCGKHALSGVHASDEIGPGGRRCAVHQGQRK
eukprot:GEMP01058703.1.p1 GENE.GEMP01058703.1~~GEMP01058703.1.p1  ORF type:complete len:392 (+),score=75.75 GEMP01058703.1:137-1312(+)